MLTTPDHLVLMGVAGSGKTTVARLVVERTGRTYAEADDFHPAANVAAMRAGVALTDADRAPWLAALRDWMSAQHAAGVRTVVTCSALRRAYRDVLREAAGTVRFVHLDGTRELLAARIGARTDHFMPASLLDSQLATLDPLEADEDGVRLDVAATPPQIVAAILGR
ncbi:gluconate kinase (SKI family) [Sediminihabitans luteus]|uniref:Gluconokinase n=1 Tax=Sediminihabitans luteus TaxID=1138585 RepID=A0A2M9CC41_9CELL|nr:gluconokinase [Sediminihabitans luteus]PJJ68617.1 gluconate kinase (SKI family) [Sediminihabitans luteus]GII99955.1 gluconokinase [Sediminihabitans luteus]